MARKNTKDKIESIEEQIKRLKEKQKNIITKSQKDIGKYLMDTWGIEDVNEAKSLIDVFKDQVLSLKEIATSEEKENKEKINPLKSQL